MSRNRRRAEKKPDMPVMPGASADLQQMFSDAVRHHQAGRLTEAEQLYRRILAFDSRHTDSLHLLGVIAHRKGRHAAAIKTILKGIAINPGEASYHSSLGDALRALGRLDDAVACYGQAVALKSDFAEAHHNLGLALRGLGRLDEAIDCYGRALDLRPDMPEIHHNLGLAFRAQGRRNEAVACFRRVLDVKPDSSEAHYNLGNSLADLGRQDTAVLCYGRAIVLTPGYPEAHVNLGNALLEQGRLDEAVLCYGRAIVLMPDFAEAHNNLGNVLKDQGRPEAAVVSYRTALSLKPDFAEAYYNLGLALRALGQQDAARIAYNRALDLRPDYAECRLIQAMATLPILVETTPASTAVPVAFARSLDHLIAWGHGRLATLGRAVGAGQPFYLAYRPGDHLGMLSRFGDLSASAAKAYWQDQRGSSGWDSPVRERIRIGVVSAHIRHHPVWDVVLRGIIDGLDRRRFEILVYHTRPDADEETAWARDHVDRFVPGPQPMETWLREIAADRPDILFYPEIGMDPVTYALAALRLAPIQVAGWGHPITTGLPTIDLFISGALLEGADADRHYRERLARLPGTGVSTETLAADGRPVDRQALGLPADRTVVCFALCQTPFKFDPAYDPLYARIAKAAGPCQFWLARDKKYPWASERLLRRLAAAFRSEGLDPDDHLRMMPWLPRDMFTGFLEAMDIALDCPAFSGYTTAWQAVHGGLPIVTLEGMFLRQRLAAGLLRQIGQTEGIAVTEEAYVAIATRWAQESRQPTVWAARRDAIRRAAPRADGNRAAVRAFERVLTDALRLHQAKARGATCGEAEAIDQTIGSPT